MGNAYGIPVIWLTDFHFTLNWPDNKRKSFFETKDLCLSG